MEVIGTNVDDVASDRLSRVERKGEVLVDLVNAQLVSFVDRSFVYGVRLGEVDEHAESTLHR